MTRCFSACSGQIAGPTRLGRLPPCAFLTPRKKMWGKGRERRREEQASCCQTRVVGILWSNSPTTPLNQRCVMGMLQSSWRGEHSWAREERKRIRKTRVEVRREGKSRWKCSVFLLQCTVWFSPRHQKPHPTLRAASALGNGLKSKTGTMRIKARAGRGNWLIVSAVSHWHGQGQHFARGKCFPSG